MGNTIVLYLYIYFTLVTKWVIYLFALYSIMKWSGVQTLGSAVVLWLSHPCGVAVHYEQKGKGYSVSTGTNELPEIWNSKHFLIIDCFFFQIDVAS